MSLSICAFNDEGVAAFQGLIDAERNKVKHSQPARVGEDFFANVERLVAETSLTIDVPGCKNIDTTKQFRTRYEFGAYINEALTSEMEKVQYTNIGLWAWIAAAYMRQQLKPSKSGSTHELWSSYRYIPLSYSKFRYYRHLVFISFWLHRQLGDNAARLFLTRPMYEHSDAIERLYTSDKDFLTTPALIEMSLEMYLEPGDKGMKRNYLGRDTPGSAVRLATKIAKQLQMNFDLHSMTKEQIYELLPPEFDKWRANVAAQSST